MESKMRKTFVLASLLATGFAFAAANQAMENSMNSVQNSMNKVADAANSGVSKMVHGVKNMANSTENFGKKAVDKMERPNKKTADASKPAKKS